MSDFKIEERYIVVKLKDNEDKAIEELRGFLQSYQIPTQECAVVEPDWPNYEDTWKAIEQVANGEYVDRNSRYNNLSSALRFYANGEHYFFDNEDWDSNVDGETPNWLSNVECESTEMVEDGGIARKAIDGEIAGALNHIRANAIELALESVQASDPMEFCENMRCFANKIRNGK